MEGRRECLIHMTISRLSCPKTSASPAVCGDMLPQLRPRVLATRELFSDSIAGTEDDCSFSPQGIATIR